MAANGLSVLERLGALESVASEAYPFADMAFTNKENQVTYKWPIGDQLVGGYSALRVFRKVVLAKFKAMARERAIPIHYNSRFSGVVQDTSDGVSFIINGETMTAGLLVGADGIHSKVREHICPEAKLEYEGILSLAAHVPSSKVRYPSPEYPRIATILSGPDAVLTTTDSPDASLVMIARQVPYPEQDRAGWTAIAQDFDKLMEIMSKDYEQLNDISKSLVEAAREHRETAIVWPFYRAEVREWVSDSGRAVLIGDAAHAVPPSSGQGVNQAIEDAYSLGRVLASLGSGKNLNTELRRWRDWRKARVGGLVDYVKFQNAARAAQKEGINGSAEQNRMTAKEMRDRAASFAWVYQPQFGDSFERWLNAG